MKESIKTEQDRKLFEINNGKTLVLNVEGREFNINTKKIRGGLPCLMVEVDEDSYLSVIPGDPGTIAIVANPITTRPEKRNGHERCRSDHRPPRPEIESE